MKLTKSLLMTAALAVAPMAFADNIVGQMSGTGYTNFTNSEISFSGPFTTNGDSGIFSGLNGGTVSFTSGELPYTTTPGVSSTTLMSYPATAIYSVTGVGANAGESVTFYSTGNNSTITSYPVYGTSQVDESLMINGVGYFVGNFFNGQVAGSYSLTTQGEPVNGVASSLVSFSGTTDATAPEPASLALLGSGLLAAGAIFRRRRNAEVKA